MRLDLPTFDRPINAYSGLVSLGHIDTIGALSVNSAFFISISDKIWLQSYEKKLEKFGSYEKSVYLCTRFSKTRFRSGSNFHSIFKFIAVIMTALHVCIQKKN
jgi:hypothetical protein